jgi:hypothetical protein
LGYFPLLQVVAVESTGFRRIVGRNPTCRIIRVHAIVERMAVIEEGPRTLDEQLRFAIANRRLMQLRYGGCLRVVEPHDYGVQKGTPRLAWFFEELFRGSRRDSHQRHYVWDVLYARVEQCDASGRPH